VLLRVLAMRSRRRRGSYGDPKRRRSFESSASGDAGGGGVGAKRFSDFYDSSSPSRRTQTGYEADENEDFSMQSSSPQKGQWNKGRGLPRVSLSETPETDHHTNSDEEFSCCSDGDDELSSGSSNEDKQAGVNVDSTERLKSTQSTAQSSGDGPSQWTNWSAWFNETTTVSNNNSNNNAGAEPHESVHDKDRQIAKRDPYTTLRDAFVALVTGWLPSVFETSTADTAKDDRPQDEGRLDDDMSSISRSTTGNDSDDCKRDNRRIPLTITIVPLKRSKTVTTTANETSLWGLKVNLPLPWKPSVEEANSDDNADPKSTLSLVDLGRGLLMPAMKQLGEMFSLKMDAPSAATAEKERDVQKGANSGPSATNVPSVEASRSKEEEKTFQSPNNGGRYEDEVLERLSERFERSMDRRQDSRRSLVSERSRKSCSGGQPETSSNNSRRSLYKRQYSSQSLISRRSVLRRCESPKSGTALSASRGTLNQRRETSRKEATAATEKETIGTREQKSLGGDSQTNMNVDDTCGSGEGTSTLSSPHRRDVSAKELFNTPKDERRSTGRRQAAGRSIASARPPRGPSSSLNKRESSPNNKRSTYQRQLSKPSLVRRRSSRERRDSRSLPRSDSRRSPYQLEGSDRSFVEKPSRRNLYRREGSTQSMLSMSSMPSHRNDVASALKMAQADEPRRWSHYQRQRSSPNLGSSSLAKSPRRPSDRDDDIRQATYLQFYSD
jgi:hypothetical protein